MYNVNKIDTNYTLQIYNDCNLLCGNRNIDKMRYKFPEHTYWNLEATPKTQVFCFVFSHTYTLNSKMY